MKCIPWMLTLRRPVTEKMDHISHYECVDLDLGAQLWQYDAPACESDLRRRLENHLDICHACRIALGIQERVADGLHTGEFDLGEKPRRTNPIFGGGGLAVAAAAMLLIFLLPPRSLEDMRTVRGDGSLPRFERPVAGEVVWKSLPRISWTAIEFARVYRVRIQEVGGSFEWVGESAETHIALPADTALPSTARLRVLLETVPSYLVPPEGISTSIRTDGLGAFLSYRAMAAPAWLQWIGGLGLLLSLLALGRAFTSRR